MPALDLARVSRHQNGMREPSLDYRTAATPKPVVRELRVSSVGETAILVFAALLALPIGFAFALRPSFIAAAFGVVPVMVALFARYGRSSARVEYLPRSGEVEIVAGGFLSKETRRRFRTGDIHCVRVERLEDRGLAIPPMDMLVLELENRRIEHVFGRPLGLPPPIAEALRAQLERAIDEARVDGRKVRVDVGEEGLRDEGLDAALGGSATSEPVEDDVEDERRGKDPSRRAVRRGRPF